MPDDVFDLDEHYGANPDFPEVPRSLCQPDRWSKVMMGKQGYTSEHITLKEGVHLFWQ